MSRDLHNKLLYADAATSKADWSTNAGSIAGVLRIGVGWWWANGGTALFVSPGILRDGWSNTKHAVLDLMDESAMTFDQGNPHPLIRALQEDLMAREHARHTPGRTRPPGATTA